MEKAAGELNGDKYLDLKSNPKQKSQSFVCPELQSQFHIFCLGGVCCIVFYDGLASKDYETFYGNL